VCVCVYVCVCVMTTSVVIGAEGCGGVGADTKERGRRTRNRGAHTRETDWSESLKVIEACT